MHLYIMSFLIKNKQKNKPYLQANNKLHNNNNNKLHGNNNNSNNDNGSNSNSNNNNKKYIYSIENEIIKRNDKIDDDTNINKKTLEIEDKNNVYFNLTYKSSKQIFDEDELLNNLKNNIRICKKNSNKIISNISFLINYLNNNNQHYNYTDLIVICQDILNSLIYYNLIFNQRIYIMYKYTTIIKDLYISILKKYIEISFLFKDIHDNSFISLSDNNIFLIKQNIEHITLSYNKLNQFVYDENNNIHYLSKANNNYVLSATSVYNEAEIILNELKIINNYDTLTEAFSNLNEAKECIKIANNYMAESIKNADVSYKINRLYSSFIEGITEDATFFTIRALHNSSKIITNMIIYKTNNGIDEKSISNHNDNVIEKFLNFGSTSN